MLCNRVIIILLVCPVLALAQTSSPVPRADKDGSPDRVDQFPPPSENDDADGESPGAAASASPQWSEAAGMRDAISWMNLEKEKLAAQIALGQTKLDSELASSRASALRLQARISELKAQQELAEIENKLSLDKELLTLRRQLDRATLESNIAKAETETEASEIRHLENAARRETVKLAGSMELEQKQAEARTYAMTNPAYLTEPLQGHKLVISDRRVPLNGPIGMDTADRIIARISYYNNRDRALPIFLIIDDCPGGSVMAGYKILKAMHGSEAPVYVVVKSFAASMAACITTLADKSFAYPNAVILHHQMSAFSGGNLTQQQEWVKEMEEWWRRLADPVAKKMGVSRDEFVKQMYAHASTGDWSEFADNAKKLKWVDEIVDQIEETAMVRDPDSRPANSSLLAGAEISSAPVSPKATVDEKGRPCMILPRLNPLDCYWIYNPDSYYRLP
jgi:ATP-dependent Clp protease protease subunit